MANAEEQIEILRYLQEIEHTASDLSVTVLHFPESITGDVRASIMGAVAHIREARDREHLASYELSR